MSDDISGGLREILAGELGISPEEIEDTADVRDLPGVESVKILRAVTKIEKRYGVELDDGVVFRISTIRELAAVVADQLRVSA